MKHENAKVSFDKLVKTPNQRLSVNESYNHILADGLLERGLDNPLVVIEDKDGNYPIQEGRCRYLALQYMKDKHTEAFAKFFSEGIPVSIVREYTERDLAMIRCNHSEKQSLSHTAELCAAYADLRNAGITEKEAIGRLYLLFLAICRPATEKVGKVKELMGNGKNVEALNELSTMFHSQCQFFESMRLLPDVIYKSWRALLEGRKTLEPSDYPVWWKPEDRDLLPDFSVRNVIRELWKQFQSDKEVVEKGQCIFGKEKPGPKFLKAFQKVLDDEREKTPKETVKKVSGKELLEIADTTKSESVKSALKQISGKESFDKSIVERIDEIVNMVEYIRIKNPSFKEIKKALDLKGDDWNVLETLASYSLYVRDSIIAEKEAEAKKILENQANGANA